MNVFDESIAAVQLYMERIEGTYLSNEQVIAMLLTEHASRQKDVALAEILYQTAKDALLLGHPRRSLRYAVLLECELQKLQSVMR